MHVARNTSRSRFLTRQIFHGPSLELQSIAGYSTSGRSPGSTGEAVMFKKAVKDHSGTTAKPLQSNLLQTNVVPQPKPPPPLPQSIGVKRKMEIANAGESSLGSLHNAVYFDENDFDDDDDLNFSDPDPPIPTQITAPLPSTRVPDTIDLTNTNGSRQSDLSNPKRLLGNDRTSPEIKYPDLPPVPDDNGAPPSSIPYPWSSSPPSHFKPPSNPRTMPWLKKVEAKSEPQQSDSTAKPVTPARSKNIVPWMKTESAIKKEQKEMRRQNKKDQVPEPTFKTGQVSAKASFFLSDEQKHVLDAVVKNGKSIFFTGSAGTGKSVLMREIIKQLRNKYRREQDRVAITASTGLAACNIGGVTLHSFAGIGLGKEPVPELVKKVRRNQKARARWLRTKVLVVDEVSMVDGDLFDKLEELARRIRNNGRPFGGIQLVVTGDFFQLPPVPEGANREAKFAFSAATWNTSIQHTILLTYIFRQRDPQFAGMLNEMRLGKLSPRTIDAFRQLSRPLNFQDALEATELFPTRQEVENANGVRMSKLSGDLMTFNAVDSGTIQDVQIRDKLLSNCMAPPTIHLKKGAQVMLIKNMEESLVNGSIGRVVAFMDEATYDYYTDHEGEFGAPEGEGEEAMEEAIRARKKIKSHANKDGGVIASRKWPLVCFPQPDGTERHLLCQPETWKIELPNGEVQAQRQQVPLILAWALSIHKAQGQTLPRVKVDLGRVFEKGQAYVALSRATTQAGLQVTRFDARKVMVHPKVIDFYSKLVSISDVLETQKSTNRQPSGNEFEDDLDDKDYLQQMYD